MINTTVGENIIATTKIQNNYGSLSKVIALPTIAIAIVVALSGS